MPVTLPIDIIKKSPQADLSYSWDWVDWLDSAASPAATISSSAWYVVSPAQGSPADLVLSNENVQGSVAQVKISGGQENVIYRIRNHVIASDGEEDDVYFDIAVMP